MSSGEEARLTDSGRLSAATLLHLSPALQEERPLPDLYPMKRVTDLSLASSTVHVKRPMNAFMVNITFSIFAHRVVWLHRFHHTFLGVTLQFEV